MRKSSKAMNWLKDIACGVLMLVLIVHIYFILAVFSGAGQ